MSLFDLGQRLFIVAVAAFLFALPSVDGAYAANKKTGAMAGYQKTDRVRCNKGTCQTGAWVKKPIPGKNCSGPTGYKGKNYFCPN
jgi:hypothetical protein